MTTHGTLLTFATMVLWAIDMVYTRWAATALSADPIIFTCLSLMVSAWFLILIAGPGLGGIATLRRPHTWIYGLFQVAMNISQMLAMLYITNTEISLVSRFNIILALLLAWMFFDRRPRGSDWLGMPFIVAGVIYVAVQLPAETRFIGLFWIVLGAFFNTARTIIAETHPESLGALTIKARCRVTGYVLLATSICFLLATLGAANVAEHIRETGQNPDLLTMLPTVGDFLHQPTMFSAMILGATVLPVAMYFYFYAAKVVKTESFMIMMTFLPFLIFAVEWLASLFGLVDITQITTKDIIAGLVITAGALVMVLGRRQRLKKEKNLA